MGLQYRKPSTGCQSGTGAKAGDWLEAWWPGACLLCGGRADGAGLCRGCRADLPVNAHACRRCALPLGNPGDQECGACLARAPPWKRARAPLLYAFPADVLVTALKFRRQLAAGAALARALESVSPPPDLPAPPLLVPVPLHPARHWLRGYNQAHEIARHLACGRGWKLAGRRLLRRRRTRAQTGLDAAGRRRNLRGAFAWRGPGLAGRPVILVDDVLTTGSTAAECAKVLRRNGAGWLEVWVAARAVLR